VEGVCDEVPHLAAQREEVVDVARLEEALLARVPQHLPQGRARSSSYILQEKLQGMRCRPSDTPSTTSTALGSRATADAQLAEL